ncbi:MAG TPA: PCYCGC motif-containing (lipo)protein, partial [Anaerolineae bacterium]
IPCYCGCGKMGHKSNYACYVKGADTAGKPVFDSHALGCSICVDITQDAMRLTREGKSPQDIRAYVDAAYSKYGPSNLSN